MKIKYADMLGSRKLRVPMKPGVDKLLMELKPTEEEHAAVADNLTKANPTDLFKYLRDSMNGYAAAMLNDPDREMPVECITMSELSSMLKSLAEQDAMKAAKKAEQAAKKRKKWNFEFKPFSLKVQVLLVNSKVVVSK